MYKLSFYVPPSALESVKTALFEAGAGRIGNYDQCCWQVKGSGQFRSLPGSRPAIGEQNELKELEEWKVDLVCEDALIKTVVKALKAAHPYEEVAYEVLKLVDEETIVA
jgi:hypothetical protein